jgi:hypothetical protein
MRALSPTNLRGSAPVLCRLLQIKMSISNYALETIAQTIILKKMLVDKPNAESRDEIRKRLAELSSGR